MPRLEWDKSGKKFFETGVSQGVLYTKKETSSGSETVVDPYGTAEVWNGLISVSESPEGADITDMYADDIKYASIRAAEKFKATLECYTYPDTFAACNGEAELVTGAMVGQQSRAMFGIAYKTKIGNDVEGLDLGYKLHLIYGCTASPSEKSYETVNDSPDAMTFSYEIDTNPVDIPDEDGLPHLKPTACIVIDSRTADPTKLAALENILYGTNGSGSTEETYGRLPLPAEVRSTLAAG